jgi:hypothetical protein
MSTTLFAASSNRCLGDVLGHKVGFNKKVLHRRQTHARQLLIHLRPRSKLRFLQTGIFFRKRSLRAQGFDEPRQRAWVL